VSSSTVTPPANSPARVLAASLIGTTIEFFDFYVYATAAVLIFPKLFFPASDPTSALLQSFATFAIAFFARPIGAAIFGHFGDRIGRKATLVAALMTMGISTVLIGLLPGYETIGVAAPLLLALCRLGQGLGLGGEWGGAVLLATENAPPGKQAWYGMFPQLGAPIGFILANGSFLALDHMMTNEQFLNWGWRLPFIISAALVLVGLYVRLKVTETPAFRKAVQHNERVRAPMLAVLREYPGALVLGSIGSMATFVLFYLMTVFCLSWGTARLGIPRDTFLPLQMLAVVFFGIGIPVSAVLADRLGRLWVLIGVSLAIAVFGFFTGPMFGSGNIWLVGLYLIIGLTLMGFTYGPLGTALAELFPTSVRYTGSSLTFNIGGILGASLAPYIATSLATTHGLGAVGWYLTIAALLTAAALALAARRIASHSVAISPAE